MKPQRAPEPHGCLIGLGIVLMCAAALGASVMIALEAK